MKNIKVSYRCREASSWSVVSNFFQVHCIYDTITSFLAPETPRGLKENQENLTILLL